MSQSKLVAISLVALFAAACGMDSALPPPPPTNPTNPTNPNNPVTPPTPEKVDPPIIDAGLASTTCAATIGVSGQAGPGLTVFATGGAAASGISTDVHPVTGRFCLPVTLKPGFNTLDLRVQDPVLGLSDAVTVNVQLDDCNGKDDTTPDAPAQPDPRNIALGAPARAMEAPSKGNFGFLTDDKASTSATFGGGAWYCPWCDYSGWVAVKLDKVYKLSEIKITWRDTKYTSDKYFGKAYKVLVTSVGEPTDPNLDDGIWVEVGTVTDGDGGLDTFDLKNTQPLAQHVALWLQQDGGTSWNETFAVAEIEVWDAPDKVAPPQTNTEVCAGN